MERDTINNWTRVGIGTPRSIAEVAEGDGCVHVNPESDGRRTLSYAEYLRLSDLLSAQVPATNVPDERVFIIAHQMMELAFRQSIFDLYVISKTFVYLAEAEYTGCKHLCLYSGGFEAGNAEAAFWRPSRSASARLRMNAEAVVPTLLMMLGRDGSPTFSTREFAAFREALEPASGFQSSQFRLIERAFGKARLLNLPVFPHDTYARNYSGQEPRALSLGCVEDPSFYGTKGLRGLPHEPEVIEHAARLEAYANAVLARLTLDGGGETSPPPCAVITHEQVSEAVSALKRIFSLRAEQPQENVPRPQRRGASEAVAAFERSLREVAAAENRARDELGDARRGAYALKLVAPSSALVEVLDGLVASDVAFFGQHPGSFLSEHLAVAMTRIKALGSIAAEEGKTTPASGTGGGGPAYLAWRRKYLIPLFPMLPSYRGLEEAEVLSWVA